MQLEICPNLNSSILCTAAIRLVFCVLPKRNDGQSNMAGQCEVARGLQGVPQMRAHAVSRTTDAGQLYGTMRIGLTYLLQLLHLIERSIRGQKQSVYRGAVFRIDRNAKAS